MNFKEEIFQIFTKIRPLKPETIFSVVKRLPSCEKYERMREALVKTILAFSYEF